MARFAPLGTHVHERHGLLIPNLTDGNANTAWISYGFGTANYAGTIKEFGLALKLQTPTVVSKLTIQQNTGTGGSFTVYTNSSASLSGAVEVGKGTFEGKDAVVNLDTSKQSAEKGAYVIIVVNELPRLSLPIGVWNYGLRINEIRWTNQPITQRRQSACTPDTKGRASELTVRKPRPLMSIYDSLWQGGYSKIHSARSIWIRVPKKWNNRG